MDNSVESAGSFESRIKVSQSDTETAIAIPGRFSRTVLGLVAVLVGDACLFLTSLEARLFAAFDVHTENQIVFWAIGLIVGAICLFRILWLLFGSETLSVKEDRLTWSRGFGPIAYRRRFFLGEITDLSLMHSLGKGAYGSSGGISKELLIRITVRRRKYWLGSNSTSEGNKIVVRTLREAGIGEGRDREG